MTDLTDTSILEDSDMLEGTIRARQHLEDNKRHLIEILNCESNEIFETLEQKALPLLSNSEDKSDTYNSYPGMNVFRSRITLKPHSDSSSIQSADAKKLQCHRRSITNLSPIPSALSLSNLTLNPYRLVLELQSLMGVMREIMNSNFDSFNSTEGTHVIQSDWCSEESSVLFRERWDKLFKDICDVCLNSRIMEIFFFERVD